MEPIPTALLGRYENTEGNHNKYWTCVQTLDGTYQVTWGPRGAQDIKSRRQVVSVGEALSRIREKLRSGYKHTQDHTSAVVALDRLTLESLFEASTPVLKRRSRKPVAPNAIPSAPSIEDAPVRTARRRL